MATISTLEAKSQSRAAKWGWGILLIVCVLLALNGLAWFFFGPQRVAVDIQAFEPVDLNVVRLMETSRQQVAIWYLSFGLLSLLVALEGFRHASRWAWSAMWVVLGALVAVGVLYRTGFGVYLLGLAVVALIGQLLAWKGLSPLSGRGESGIQGYAE